MKTEFKAVPLVQLTAAMQANPGNRIVNVQGQIVYNLKPFSQRFWFEYHCWESHQSSDALLWYRSHQRVTVVGFGNGDPCFFKTLKQRGENGHLLVYVVRFDDGEQFTVFEDELLDSRKQFCRPNPPGEQEIRDAAPIRAEAARIAEENRRRNKVGT